jgi:hypothetical protein
MDQTGVERVVRSLITQYGLPLTLVGIAKHDNVWTLDLRETPSIPLTVTIHDGPGASIRRALMRALDLDD